MPDGIQVNSSGQIVISSDGGIVVADVDTPPPCCCPVCACCTVEQFKDTVLATFSGIGVGICYTVGPDGGGNTAAFGPFVTLGVNAPFCLTYDGSCTWVYAGPHITTTLSYLAGVSGGTCGDLRTIVVTSSSINIVLNCLDAATNQWCLDVVITFEVPIAISSATSVFSKIFTMVCGTDTTVDNEIIPGTQYESCQGTFFALGDGSGSGSLNWGVC